MVALNRSRPLPIGLNLGSRYVSLVQLAGSPGNRHVHAMAYGEVPYDCDESTEEQDHEISAILKKLVADHHFKGKNVVSCLGSQELFMQNVRLPQLPPEEVEKVVRWEAEERLPYSVDEAQIRYLIAGQVRQDDNVKQEVILMACHQGVIKRHIGILEQAGLVPIAIDVEPCAVLRSFRFNEMSESTKQRVAYLHLGENSTTVFFAEDAQILFLKLIASGGRQLDQAVARHLELSLEEAARMRADVTNSDSLDPEDEIHRSIVDAIRNPLENIASEIELCLRYFKVTFRGRPLENIVVTGNEACPWLAEFLTDRLPTSCELGNPFDGIAETQVCSSVKTRPGCWATAVGLSLK